MTSNSFTTWLGNEVATFPTDRDDIRLRIVRGDEVMVVRLNKDDQQKLITLLTEGELPGPDPKPGDIVRFRPERTPGDTPWVAESGALAKVSARVPGVGHPWVYIEWIDARAHTQSNGGYDKESLEVVDVDDLTDEDHRHILNRVLGRDS